eukprot:13459617-Alexandrium_andersonii.AAC.1
MEDLLQPTLGEPQPDTNHGPRWLGWRADRAVPVAAHLIGGNSFDELRTGKVSISPRTLHGNEEGIRHKPNLAFERPRDFTSHRLDLLRQPIPTRHNPPGPAPPIVSATTVGHARSPATLSEHDGKAVRFRDPPRPRTAPLRTKLGAPPPQVLGILSLLSAPLTHGIARIVAHVLQ